MSVNELRTYFEIFKSGMKHLALKNINVMVLKYFYGLNFLRSGNYM